MLTDFLQFHILLTAWMLAQCQGCDTGWFGKKCEFLCHCLNSETCNINGQCPNNGPCEKGFFGQGCQHVDLLQMNYSNSVDQYLRDGNDTTCNPQTSSKVVSLSFTESVPFLWLRLALKNKKNMLNFTTTLNGWKKCINERKFPVSDTLVDVICDTDTMNKLKISGAAAGSLCSIYISGGRNVALKQTANQSSIYEIFGYTKSRPENAVDGDSNDEPINGHCMVTDTSPLPPWWSVTFSQPHILYRVVIHNIVDSYLRLSYFRLETFDKDNTVIYNFERSNSSSPSKYDINVYKKTPVASLKLTRTDVPVKTFSRHLSICELEAFGERVCPSGTYGFYCEKCRCNVTSTCHPLSGLCTPGCQPGFYRWNCSSRCGHCLHGVCAFTSGECPQCSPGYMGAKCDKACKQGTFGSNCVFNCSKQCTNICDSKKGNCSCKAGFGGALCAACKHGTFGPNCRFKCSKQCSNVCDRKNGNCSCKAGFGGPECAACKQGTFGPNCRFNCSKQCTNVCDSKNGNCSCQAGFGGAQCAACSPGTFGPNCRFNCPKHCSNVCDIKNGNCSCKAGFGGAKCAACNPGTFGTNCIFNCSEQCTNVCDSKNGNCSCQAGFGGAKCAACSPGTFGPDCRFNCSKHCTNACDSKNGNCICPTGFAGEQCTDCAETWYGLNCENRCSGFCGDMLCDTLTGECLTCPGNRVGNFCRDCPVKYYGALCTSMCNIHCLNGTCDQVSGQCVDCEAGYEGPLCLEKKPTFYLFLGPFFPVCLLIFACILACSERIQDEEEEEEEDVALQPVNPL